MRTLSDLAARSTYLANLANAVAPSVAGFWKAKLALALLYVQPTRPDAQSDNISPTILLSAPETRQRSQLLETFHEFVPIGRNQSLFAGSTQPIVADVEKVASDWWVETGPLVHTNGVASIDGLEYIAETQEPYVSQALTESQVHLAKAGIEITLDTCRSLIATCAPTAEYSDSSQLNTLFEHDLTADFDLVLHDGPNIATKQAKLTQIWTEGADTVLRSGDAISRNPGIEVYRSALTEARSIEQPEIDDSVQKRLRESTLDCSVLVWLTTALAKISGQQRVRQRDLDRAERVATLIFSHD
jgi:DNA replicative helicase MCM subunit Mcm2 (Cdc46/Mcm family)